MVPGLELFRSPSGQLFIVKRDHHNYKVFGVVPNYVRSYSKKYEATTSIGRGNCDPPGNPITIVEEEARGERRVF